jgi:hypothetical protein
MTTSAYNMNAVEKQVHKMLFENEMSIWLRNRARGVHPDKEGKMLKFSLSIIHGSGAAKIGNTVKSILAAR